MEQQQQQMKKEKSVVCDVENCMSVRVSLYIIIRWGIFNAFLIRSHPLSVCLSFTLCHLELLPISFHLALAFQSNYCAKMEGKRRQNLRNEYLIEFCGIENVIIKEDAFFSPLICSVCSFAQQRQNGIEIIKYERIRVRLFYFIFWYERRKKMWRTMMKIKKKKHKIAHLLFSFSSLNSHLIHMLTRAEKQSEYFYS